MQPKLKKFIRSWLINTLAVGVAGCIVKGIHYENFPDLIIASLVLGILNAFVRPIIMLLALPLLILTLRLFMLVINALLLYFVGILLHPYFYVDDFWSAFWGALVISIVSIALNALTGTGGARVEFRRGKRPPTPGGGDGGGPVIDV
jgi:putative membrane protein